MKTRLILLSIAALLWGASFVTLHARTDMSANMVAAWELESDGADSVGSTTLTVNNAPSFVAAKQGNGVDLELGSTQYLSVADNAALSLSTDTDFTVMAWVRIESAAVDQFILAKHGEWAFDFNSGQLRFGVTDGTAYNALSEMGSAAISTWYHMCGRHNATGNVTSLRVNGGATNTEATNANGSHDGAGAFNIGATNNTNHFDGIIDQVIVWKRHLSDADCDEVYNGGTGVTLASITGGGGGGAVPCLRSLLGVGCNE